VEHLEGDGAVIFEHACKLGLEGVVCKRIDLPYWPGPSKSWIKVDFGFCVFCLSQ
jgi:bifunctional non-homologous end joining protein LigD